MPIKVTLKTFVVSVCLSLLPLTVAHGQTSTATLSGTVTDPSEGNIPNAIVRAESPETGLKREVLTDESGHYSVNFLPVGRYAVTVEAPGFKITRIQDVILEIGQTRTLDFKLDVGGVQEVVEVADTAPLLDRTSPVIGTVIQPAQLKNLPLNGRNWAGLMLLAPGAINTGEGNHLSTRFVGRARDDNNWTFDGVDATGVKDPRQESAVRLVMSMDAISEFRVNSTLYSADSGAGAGGQVQLITRGGTNQYRGTVFDYLRNDVFDARVFTDITDLPPFRLNQFGGNFGGPLVKDRTFFFINYEGIRQSQGQTFRSSVSTLR